MIKTGHYLCSMNLLPWHSWHIFQSGTPDAFSKVKTACHDRNINTYHSHHTYFTSHIKSSPHTKHKTTHMLISHRPLLAQSQRHWVNKSSIIKVNARVKNPRTISFDKYVCSNHQLNSKKDTPTVDFYSIFIKFGGSSTSHSNFQ